MRKHLPASAAGLVLCAIFAAETTLAAQSGLQVIKQASVAEVPGLHMITVRDNQLAACYTLFLMEPAASSQTAAPAATTQATAGQESQQRIREAAENYDRQIADLDAQFEAQVGRPPIRDWNNLVGWPYTFTAVTQYQLDRMKIANEYQQVLQAEIPSSSPFATPFPGMKTGSWQDLAEAVRRGVANPSPATQQTFQDPGGLGALLQSGFQQLIAAPRLTAVGPASCEAPAPGR